MSHHSKIYLTLCLLSIDFVNPPCICDRGDSSCSNKGKFDDDVDEQKTKTTKLVIVSDRSFVKFDQ